MISNWIAERAPLLGGFTFRANLMNKIRGGVCKGVTKAPFVHLAVRQTYEMKKINVKYFESYSCDKRHRSPELRRCIVNPPPPPRACMRQWTGSALFQIRRQAITWTDADFLSCRLLWTNFSEIRITIQISPLMEMHLKMSSATLRTFCFCFGNVCLHITSLAWALLTSFVFNLLRAEYISRNDNKMSSLQQGCT